MPTELLNRADTGLTLPSDSRLNPPQANRNEKHTEQGKPREVFFTPADAAEALGPSQHWKRTGEAKSLLVRFIEENPSEWYGDIGMIEQRPTGAPPPSSRRRQPRPSTPRRETQAGFRRIATYTSENHLWQSIDSARGVSITGNRGPCRVPANRTLTLETATQSQKGSPSISSCRPFLTSIRYFSPEGTQPLSRLPLIHRMFSLSNRVKALGTSPVNSLS